MRVRGGRATYGEVLGIIVMEKQFPRVPGDVGNASTYDFPVRFHVLKGFSGPEFAEMRRRVFEGDRTLLPVFVAAAQELQAAGVRAITTNCGFLIAFQEDLAAAVDVPVFTSSLMQVPLVHRLIGPRKKVGIITAQASALGPRHLEAAGAAGVPVAVAGMDEAEGHRPLRENLLELDTEVMRRDLVDVARRLVAREPSVGAIVFECANHPPWSRDVQDAVGLPVFDLVTLCQWVYRAVVQRAYQGIM
ncbi:MAG: aspartate/glutamate racemase family protein [Acetobacteraceae bacterium]|nr:aspartate/glutamate racemase family protein [Acetobacteraceae bacterium]